MQKIKGVYVRKDGRCQARYKKGVGPDGRAVYGIVYGKTIEEVVEKRRAIVGDEPEPLAFPVRLNLLILGAGSHGQNVREIAQSLRVFNRIAFLDDKKQGDDIIGVCNDALKFRGEFPCAFVAIGDVKKRKKYAKFLKESNFLIPSIISPAANISSRSVIGEGVAIFPQATINEASIGDFCVLESNSVVNNGAMLEPYCHVGCGGIVLKDIKLPSLTWVEDGEIVKKGRKQIRKAGT